MVGIPLSDDHQSKVMVRLNMTSGIAVPSSNRKPLFPASGRFESSSSSPGNGKVERDRERERDGREGERERGDAHMKRERLTRVKVDSLDVRL